MARRRKTDHFSDLSQSVMKRIDPYGSRFKSKAVSIWPKVAGEEIVRHTKGFAFRDGELVVFVDTSAWANELSVMSENLKENMNRELGEELVRSIRFTVSKRVKEERGRLAAELADDEQYRPDETPSVALSTSEKRQAEYIASTVQDTELREKALRVMIKDLEWKKGVRTLKGPQTASDGSGDAKNRS